MQPIEDGGRRRRGNSASDFTRMFTTYSSRVYESAESALDFAQPSKLNQQFSQCVAVGAGRLGPAPCDPDSPGTLGYRNIRTLPGSPPATNFGWRHPLMGSQVSPPWVAMPTIQKVALLLLSRLRSAISVVSHQCPDVEIPLGSPQPTAPCTCGPVSARRRH